LAELLDGIAMLVNGEPVQAIARSSLSEFSESQDIQSSAYQHDQAIQDVDAAGPKLVEALDGIVVLVDGKPVQAIARTSSLEIPTTYSSECNRQWTWMHSQHKWPMLTIFAYLGQLSWMDVAPMTSTTTTTRTQQ
jgi:hypothetical protein